MEHSQKMVVQPIESEIPVLHKATDENIQFSSIPKDVAYHPTINMSPDKKPKSHPILDKITKQLKIILKLAKVNGYDNNLRIKGSNNNYVDNSNIINLLNDAMITSKVLIGYNEFIKLLYESGVEPDLIINDNIKYQLMRMYEIQPKESSKDLYTKTAPTEIRTDPKVIKSNLKRTYNGDEFQELFDKPVNKKRGVDKEAIDWIFPDQDLASNKQTEPKDWIFPDPINTPLPDDDNDDYL